MFCKGKNPGFGQSSRVHKQYGTIKRNFFFSGRAQTAASIFFGLLVSRCFLLDCRVDPDGCGKA